MAQSDPGIKATVLPVSVIETIDHAGLGAYSVVLPELRKLIQSLVFYCTKSWPYWKPDQRTQQSTKPILSLPWGGNQTCNMIQLFWASSTPSTSDLRHWSHPKTDPDSKLHLHKDLSSRHIQKPKLYWLMKNCLCQSKPVMSEKGGSLLKCVNTNVRSQNHEKSGKYDTMNTN